MGPLFYLVSASSAGFGFMMTFSDDSRGPVPPFSESESSPKPSAPGSCKALSKEALFREVDSQRKAAQDIFSRDASSSDSSLSGSAGFDPESDALGGDSEEVLVRQAGNLFGRAGCPKGRRKLLAAAAVRLQRLNLSLARYLARLRQDPSEWDELWSLYDQDGTDSFFRYPAQFETLGQLLSEKATLASERTLRVLSAGSRGGFEAFSLAMAITATGLIGKGWKVSVDGFDQSLRQVRLAREAKFSGEDLTFLEPGAAKRWFEPRSGGWRFKEGLGPRIEFFQANLADARTGPLASLEGAYDVIFCRGLTFDCPDHLAGRLARTALSLLAPEGLLMTAPGELWPLSSEISLEERDGVVYLRKRQVKAKANVFFQARRIPNFNGGRSPEPKQAAPPEDPSTDSLVERFYELLGPDPDEAREIALELLSREMDRGQPAPGSLGLMLKVEERLGRADAALRLRAFLEAWESR